MIVYSEALGREICGSGTVALEISTIEERRRSGLVRFWAILAAGIAITAVLVFLLVNAHLANLIFLVVIAIPVVALVLGLYRLGKIGETLKAPALHAIAAKGGLTYMDKGFDPPVYPEARKALFGNWLSRQIFTDLFHGADENGKRFAFYEADLSRGSGKHRQTVFIGQVYAWQRRARSGSEIVIVPDRGIFNFFKPVGGMERVRLEADPEFEAKFEVYAVDPAQATMIVGANLRRALLELRQAGRVFTYIGPEDVLIAAWGPNRFEPGSMFRTIPGEERVRTMVKDVCDSLATLERLKGTIT